MYPRIKKCPGFLTLLVLVLFFISTWSVSAQESYVIKGTVIDTALSIRLSKASISVQQAKDSILTTFDWTDNQGHFVIRNLSKGKFLVLVSYPEYADYVQTFIIDSLNQTVDFGNIKLMQKARLLNEVIIKGKLQAIKVNGDTTEFNARAFAIQPNAKVEDLLRQLPGIQIDNNGKITAQGEVVKKVLVDGEEFFGDDPTLVTRNLRGDMIDKVQLYDKKSDQATFTGIDDGVRNKTLNLKLKDDKKKGYFGKVEGGVETNEFYQNQGMLNIFREKRKLALYGNVANTGKTGLSSSENNKYGTSAGTIEFVPGGIVITGANYDEVETASGRFNGQGIPKSVTSGFHYNGKWNNDRESINANYKVGGLQVDGIKNTISQNDLRDGRIVNNLDQQLSSYVFRQKIDATYQLKTSKNSSLKLALDGVLRKNEIQNGFLGSSLNGDNTLINTSNRSLTNDGNQESFSISSLYAQKLKKLGRTFSWNFTGSMNRDVTKGYLNASNIFYDNSLTVIEKDTIDQLKINQIDVNALNNNLIYTEPLSKTLTLVFNYKFGYINSNADRKSFNQSALGNYDVLDQEFSNDYLINQISNQAGAMFNYQKGKRMITFGGRATEVAFKQLGRLNDVRYLRSFMSYAPQVTYRLQISPQKLFQVRYNGNTLQPSIEQIQPVQVNTDPLNMVSGNSQLEPAFKHDFNASYNSYQAITGLLVNFLVGYSSIDNAIVNEINSDEFGRNRYLSINFNDKNETNFTLRSTLSKQIESIGSTVSLSINYYNTNNYGISNGEVNKRSYERYDCSLSFYKSKSKKYDFSVRFRPTRFTGSSSLQNQLNNNGYAFDAQSTLTLYLPGKFEFRYDLNYDYQSKTDVFKNSFSKHVTNTALAKKFLKNEGLKASLIGNDIFNENVGFSRSSFGTIVTQNSYTSIARYFMFSLTWDFSRFGDKKNI